MPTPAPMIASGMISQLAQPSNGMKAMTAKINATKPMIRETRLNMIGLLASFGRLRQPRRAQHRDDIKRQRGPDRGEGDRMRGR